MAVYCYVRQEIGIFSSNEARSLTELTAMLLDLDAFNANNQLVRELSTLAQMSSEQPRTCSQSQMKKIKQCCLQLSNAVSSFSGLIANDVSDTSAGVQVSAALNAFDKSRAMLRELTLNLTQRDPGHKEHGYGLRALSLEEFNAFTGECFERQLVCYFENPLNPMDESQVHYKAVQIDGRVKQGIISMQEMDYNDDIDTVAHHSMMKLLYPILKQHDVLAPVWENGGLSMQMMIASSIQTLLELQMASFLMQQGLVSPIDVLKKVACLKSNDAYLWRGFCAYTPKQDDVVRAYLPALDAFVSQITAHAHAQALLAFEQSHIHEALSAGCDDYTFNVEKVRSMMRMQHRLSKYVVGGQLCNKSCAKPPANATQRMDVEVFLLAIVDVLCHPGKLNANKALLFSFAMVALMIMMQKTPGPEATRASEGVVVHAKR